MNRLDQLANIASRLRQLKAALKQAQDWAVRITADLDELYDVELDALALEEREEAAHDAHV